MGYASKIMARKDEGRDLRLDLLFGRVALERGLIADGQLREALAERALGIARGRKVPRPLRAILPSKSRLTDVQAAALAGELEQRIAREEEGRRKDAFLGQILIDSDLVAPGHVEECLFDQAERWKEGEDPLPRLGELLVLKGYATQEDVAQAFVLQRSMLQVCSACRRESSVSESGDACPVCGGAFLPQVDSTIIPAPVASPAPAAPGRHGPTLAELRASGAFPLRRQVRVLRDVALALDSVHGRGLAHLGLSPASIRIDGRGKPLIVEVEAGAESPCHMSPERARGDRGVGAPADLWSLGVLLYEALAGRPPFVGETREATLAKVMCEPAVPPSTLAPSAAGRPVFRPLETLCLRALEKRPARRPASARDFAEELSAWLKGEEAAASRPKPADRRRWIALAAGILLALAGAAAGLGLATAESRSERTLKRARAYLAAGQHDAAVQLYDRVLEREPANAQALAGRDAAKARLAGAPARP